VFATLNVSIIRDGYFTSKFIIMLIYILTVTRLVANFCSHGTDCCLFQQHKCFVLLYSRSPVIKNEGRSADGHPMLFSSS
jgi:hypothetical protein